MTDAIPSHVRELRPASERHVQDSLFWASGYVFPEVREPLWPDRTFPIEPGTDQSAEAVLEIQAMGLQYTVLLQHRRERGLSVTPPSTWDSEQLLWTDLPVFGEETCHWHYPHVQFGFNVAHCAPPDVLRPDTNTPELFGYLPNGDILLYWALAEPLAAEFELDIEALPSSVDDCALVVSRGLDEATLPVGQGIETGILLARSELDALDEAKAWIHDHGGLTQTLMPPDDVMFYRLAVPMIRSEAQMNPYVEHTIPALDVTYERLATFSFRIIDNPVSRDVPIFATERGNVVVSASFFEQFSARVRQLGGPSPGAILPVIRTP